MSKYKNINKLLLGVFLVCLSSVSHGSGMLPHEEEAHKLADLTVPVATRAEVARNILFSGAPEHRQAASAAGMGLLGDLALPVIMRESIARAILEKGAPEHRQAASVACLGFLADPTLDVWARQGIARAILEKGAPEHRLEASSTGVRFLGDAALDVWTRESIARTVLAKGAPEHHRAASTAGIGFLVDLNLSAWTRQGIAQSILVKGVPEHRQEASAACLGFLGDLGLDVETRASIARTILAEGALEHRQEAAACMKFLVERPIPPEAVGYEAIYRRFLKGVLTYRPTPGSDAGKIDMLIEDLANPLGGTFELGGCGDTGRYLSINTGYKKGKIAGNESKVEMWLAPRFLIERELGTTAGHFRPIMNGWNSAEAPVGVFWTWGDWTVDVGYDYLTTKSLENLSSKNMYENWGFVVRFRAYGLRVGRVGTQAIADCERFHAHF